MTLLDDPRTYSEILYDELSDKFKAIHGMRPLFYDPTIMTVEQLLKEIASLEYPTDNKDLNLPTPPKTWAVEDIKTLLQESDKAVARAIVAIYNRQTEDEKITQETSKANGVGYSGAHANFMSSLACFYTSKGFLTKGQLQSGRKIIMKYAKQLASIANEV